jgi:5-formyltetrahydrofolate cyclo-ligase
MKKQLRKEIFKKRQQLSAEEYQAKSRVICDKLLQHPNVQKANSVHIYYPINQEVDVRSLIEYLWSSNKKVVMPRADFETKEMVNYFVISYGQLEETKYGLMEPRTNSPLQIGSPDLVIVPGVAFSIDRYRLGYGGGFYDRWLAGVESFRLGVAFDLQIVTKLPVEIHDVRLNQIITETRNI